MSGGTRTDKRIRTELVGVRLTPGERDHLAAVAAEWGQTLPSLLREAALTAIAEGRYERFDKEEA